MGHFNIFRITSNRRSAAIIFLIFVNKFTNLEVFLPLLLCLGLLLLLYLSFSLPLPLLLVTFGQLPTFPFHICKQFHCEDINGMFIFGGIILRYAIFPFFFRFFSFLCKLKPHYTVMFETQHLLHMTLQQKIIRNILKNIDIALSQNY